jgi:zinc transporter, ZIP family
MIDEIRLSGLVTLLIFAGMILGGCSIRIMFSLLNKNTLYLQILCGGLLTGLFTFELLPEIFRHFQTIGIFTGISIGIFIMITMEVLLHNKNNLHYRKENTLFLLLVALIIHSLPTGLSFGMSLLQGQQIDFGLLLTFFLHHIPEGMIIMSSITSTKRKNRLFTIFCSTLSLVIGVNIFIGLSMRVDSIKWSTVMMGMTLGTMGYVTFYELLWKKSKSLPKGKVVLIVILGMVGIHYFLRFIPAHQ